MSDDGARIDALEKMLHAAELACEDHVDDCLQLEAELHRAEAEVARLREALRVADYRLAEVSNYLGPFDHALMFRSLTETIREVRSVLGEVR